MVAFDFDNTIAIENTDIIIRNLVFPTSEEIPSNYYDVYKEFGWTRYMQSIFDELHKQHINQDDIVKAIQAIPEMPGILNLIKELKKLNFDIIIISDSNEVFINEWLEFNNIKELVNVIFTNTAKFDDLGLLNILPYHYQTDCPNCTTSICKGKILNQFKNEKIEKNINYKRVLYVGDGGNDYCPVLQLAECDYGCARDGFPLAKKLNRLPENDEINVKATILYWKDGYELLEQILLIIK